MALLPVRRDGVERDALLRISHDRASEGLGVVGENLEFGLRTRAANVLAGAIK
jgi:hypothetical protein